MPNYQNILFDLDGTLTDPVEGITKSVQYALKKSGVLVEDLATLHPFIGPPLVDSFMEFYGFSQAQAMTAQNDYRERFEKTGMFENVPYPGIHACLQGLLDSGKNLFVASSKPEKFVRIILEHFELSRYFVFAGGSGLDGSRKNKAAVIRYVLDENKITDLSTAIMVGDRKHDVAGAKACGLGCIGVLFGYGDEAELLEAGACALAADLHDLETQLLAR